MVVWGREFSLVDAAFAPVFTRLALFRSMADAPEWKRLPKTREWSTSLLSLAEVRDSVKPDFRQRMASYMKARGSLLAGEIAA